MRLFLISSWAASKISIAICLRPTMRSNSRIRCWAARRALAGTTSSSDATAVSPPFVNKCFQRWICERATPSSRLNSAAVISPRSTRSTCSRLNAAA
jgi:hypothetical protein